MNTELSSHWLVLNLKQLESRSAVEYIVSTIECIPVGTSSLSWPL